MPDKGIAVMSARLGQSRDTNLRLKHRSQPKKCPSRLLKQLNFLYTLKIAMTHKGMYWIETIIPLPISKFEKKKK